MADYQPSLTAAIQIGKKMHTGRYHRDIYAKLTPEERAQAGTDGRQFGFVDEAGKYLHRATAMQYARDMGLLHPQHVNTKSPHLIAEMLADRPQRKRGGAARRGDGGGAWDAEWELPDDILPPPKAKRAPKAKKDEPLGMEHDDPRRAQNLMEWFGNSVLHDNGVPRTYYTGTSKDVDFDKFNVGRHGVWFTSDPKSASSYADENDSQGYRREGNTYVKILENVRRKDVYLVQTIGFDANDAFMELLFWIDAFKRASAQSVTAVVPYFSYAKGLTLGRTLAPDDVRGVCFEYPAASFACAAQASRALARRSIRPVAAGWSRRASWKCQAACSGCPPSSASTPCNWWS